eukprot:2499762-Rhodomonas_salina.2
MFSRQQVSNLKSQVSRGMILTSRSRGTRLQIVLVPGLPGFLRPVRLSSRTRIGTPTLSKGVPGSRYPGTPGPRGPGYPGTPHHTRRDSTPPGTQVPRLTIMMIRSSSSYPGNPGRNSHPGRCLPGYPGILHPASCQGHGCEPQAARTPTAME